MCWLATQRAYVSELMPSSANNSGVPADGRRCQFGVVLDVQATVSADRKYVTLTLRPQLRQL